MGQIPNYAKHRPRKIIYINKAVYEETDGERSMLAIIGYGTAKFSYDLTPTLIEPITDTLLGQLDPVDQAPTSMGGSSVIRYTNGAVDKLYINPVSWVESSPIGSFEIPDTTTFKNITFIGSKITTVTETGQTPVVTVERVKEDFAVDTTTLSGAYILDLAALSTTTTEEDVTTTVTYSITDPMSLYVKANRNLGGNIDDEITLINNNVVDKLGPADPDNNPLAFAASIAVTAGGGRPFYVVAYDKTSVVSPATMKAALEPALRKLSTTDRAVYLVGLYEYDSSTNKNIAVTMFQEIENHVEAMSTEEEQKWRRAYIYSNPFVAQGVSIKDYVSQVTSEVTGMSEAFDNERIINVWADHAQYASIDPETGDQVLKDLDNMYVAVGVAALRAASQPHQGLSKTNLPWINNVKSSYIKFIPSELDNIASYGTFIVCQDDAAGDVYIRHQLTTEADLGLMYWEDSIGTNVDNIAYGIKDVVEPYPGRYNIVNNALIEIEKAVADYLTGLTTTGISAEDMRLGPQLIRYENLKVWVHKQLRDRIVVSVDLVVPVPMNVVEVHLNAYITTDFEAETA